MKQNSFFLSAVLGLALLLSASGLLASFFVSCTKQQEEKAAREKDFSAFVESAARGGFVLLKNEDSYLPRPSSSAAADEALLITSSLAEAAAQMKNPAVKSILYAPELPQKYEDIRSDVLTKMTCGDYSPSGALPVAGESFPLGYGLSYTSFEQKIGRIDYDFDSGKITVEISVTNTGNMRARTVVKLFASVPASSEPASIAEKRLAAFTKTPEILAGDNFTFSLSIRCEDFARYDDEVARAYVLEAGIYSLSLDTDADSVSFAIPANIIYDDEHSGRRASDALSAKNRLDAVRATHWKETFTDQSLGYTQGDARVFGKNLSLQFADLSGIGIENALWDDFASRLTQAQALDIASNDGFLGAQTGSQDFYKIDGSKKKFPLPQLKIFKPAKIAELFPAQELIFATWDIEVARAFGACAASETQNRKYASWALRLDPTGNPRMSAAIAAGSKNAGTGVFLDTRSALNAPQFASERDIREKLLVVELAVKEGGAVGIISGIDLNTFAGIIRGEWGYTGVLISTDDSYNKKNILQALKGEEKPILAARSLHRDAKYMLYFMSQCVEY